MKIAFSHFAEVFNQKLNRAIIVGALTSRIGTLAFTAALSLYVLKITGNPEALGFTLLLGTVPFFVLALVTGIVCDRFDKKKIIIITDVARVIIASLFFVSLFTVDTKYQINIIYFVVSSFSIFESFLSTSFSSILPEVVPKEKLVDLNSTLSGLGELARLIGPVLGTVMYSFLGIEAVALFIVACFTISVLFEVGIPYKMAVRVRETQTLIKVLQLEAKGFMTLLTDDIRITSLFVNGFTTHLFLFPFVYIGTPYLISTVFGGHPTEYGVVEMFASIGGLVSVLLVPYFKKIGIAKNLLVGMIGMIVGSVLFIALLSGDFQLLVTESSVIRIGFFSVSMLIIFLSFGYYGVYFSSFLQQNIDSSNMGKGMSIVMMFNSFGRMLGFSLFGYLFTQPIEKAVIVLVVGMLLKVFIHLPFMIADNARVLQSQVAK